MKEIKANMPANIDSRPLRHISIRVPWHDDGWRGTVCVHPEYNDACLRLNRISDHRGDSHKPGQCESVAGRSIENLSENDRPCCVTERAMFMSPFAYTRTATHPYTDASSRTHGHFLPTPVKYPSYSAPALPFAWMLKNNTESLTQEYDIEVDLSKEPDLRFSTSWLQHKDNQLALSDTFFNHVKPNRSLCIFYAKEVPFVEDAGRVIIGVGWVQNVGEATEYLYSSQGELRSILWERMVKHSIRPGFADGFLMPYYELINYLNEHSDFDPTPLTAFAPADCFDQFSYASELVSHDAAIEAIQSCVGALTNAGKILGGSYESQINWLHSRFGDLWKMRGPCPGLGAALCAFGIRYGTFVARELEAKLSENENPWPLVEKTFKNPQSVLSIDVARYLSTADRDKWKVLPDDRKNLLRLLSRFCLLPDQAIILYSQEERERAGITCCDTDLIRNPYLIYELTRLRKDPVSIWTVDRGMYPDAIVRNTHPLPPPSALDGGTDPRRVRALIVHQLEKSASEGDTLKLKKDLILAIRDLDVKDQGLACQIDNDMMRVVEPSFAGTIDITESKDGSSCYQLCRLAAVGKVIRTCIMKRRAGVRHEITEDWRALLDGFLTEASPDDMEQEERAREEKAAALKELAESRFSVLIGPAGTGKTTLLSILCSHPEVAEGEVLLLAPTGKARVRMEQTAKDRKLHLTGYTIAQFLSRCDRYDPSTGRYYLSSAPKQTPAKTVIVDECSMLTEEMLAALLESLSGVERLILIGDPRQLPPIGAGRPFVDIVTEVAPSNVHSVFPKVGTGYAELTVRRRQGGAVREDIQFAEWFSGAPMSPGEDEVLVNSLYSNDSPRMSFATWETQDQFKESLLDTMSDVLSLSSVNDVDGFERSLGAKGDGNHRYFNEGCAQSAECWQILSPVRKLQHGVTAINRLIHQSYRCGTIEFAHSQMRRIPKPMGREQIVYGDKVINVVNHTRKEVRPKDDAALYIANGEIGLVVGQFRPRDKNWTPWLLKVEFSSQQGFTYDFSDKDFSEDKETYLELAYALTVHKAQGSEFNKVILVVPNPCRLLSRELLYTALTRQQDHIAIIHQGPRSELRKYTSSEFSETARRLTNLFLRPALVEHKGKFYEEHLIHHTLRGEMVRSKSELIIADRLSSNHIDYLYEQPLVLGGETRYPDFTIDDSESGRKFYWEHCGLLMDPHYRERWERKLKVYQNNDILPVEDGGGKKGTLIITQDTKAGGISSKEIDDLIKSVII